MQSHTPHAKPRAPYSRAFYGLGMSEPPQVDYSATSLRPAWSALPPAVRDAVAEALGAEVAEAGSPVRSGFTGGFAAPLKLADGRRVFVKAADDTMHPYLAYQREAEIVPQLPPAIRVPAIVATAHAADDGRKWFAVVSEWVPGRMPGVPWTGADFALVTATCERIAEAMDPSPLDGLATFVSDLGGGDPSPLQIPAMIRAGDLPLPAGLQPWVADLLPELSDLAQLAPEAFAGTAATHGDLRPDNLLIDQSSTCWTVDWNWLALGPQWMDWVGLLPVAHHHGIDTAAAIRCSPLTADVPADHLDCFAAVIAAYMMKNAEAPPPIGCTPAIREHQRFYAWTFLDWLAVRRGWLP
jgi:hypothetical protein